MNIDTILSLSYELEGLLMLAKSRGESTPEAVWQQLLEKANAVNAATVALVEQAGETVPVEVAEQFGSSELTEVPEVSSAPESVVPSEEDVADEAAEEIPAEVETVVADEQPAVVEANETADAPDEASTEALDEAVNVGTDEEAVDAAADEVVAEDAAEPVDDESIDEEPVDDDAEAAVEPMRLDEKLARESSRNLRKAFSLNDRFRFRRELFGNSDIEMSDTLNLVEAMSSYAEAVDYFMTDLQWDAENPEVADFMAIIEKHFATR
jgi:hypothetical protein